MDNEVIKIEPIELNVQHVGLAELLEQATTLVIVTANDANNGSFISAECKKAFKVLDEKRKGFTTPLNAVIGRINDGFRRPLEALKTAWGSVDEKILAFQAAERKRIDAENKERQRLIDMQVAAEKERLRKIADEERRKAVELQRQLDEEKRKRLEIEEQQKGEKKIGIDAILERNRLRKEAEEAQQREERQRLEIEELQRKAKEIENHPVLPVEMPQEKVGKILGVSIKTTQKYRVINIDLVPREYLVINHELLSDVAVKSGGNAVIEGIEFYGEESIVRRKV